MHRQQDPIYVFPEIKPRGRAVSFHSQFSVQCLSSVRSGLFYVHNGIVKMATSI
jgi:hypothetical protein